jgi:hypothetical protein
MLYRRLKGGMPMRSVILTLLLVALVAMPVLNQAQAKEKTWEDWNFYVDLYLLLVNVSGDAAITLPDGDPVDIPINLRFRDILDNYKGGVSGVIMAKKKRWSINLDLSYAKVEREQSVTLPGPPSVTVNSKNTFTLNEYEIFLGYQISDPDQGVSEIIFGTRYISQDLKLKATASGSTLSEHALDAGMDNSWWMPFLGARHVGPLAGSETWNLIIRTDVGAFDTSGKLTWRADLGTTWRFAKRWDLVLMYKWLGIDYQKGEPGDSDYYKYNAIEHGPVIGIGVKF